MALALFRFLAAATFDALGWRRLMGVLDLRPAFFEVLRVRISLEALILTLPGGAVIAESTAPALLAARCDMPVRDAVVAVAARRWITLPADAIYLAAGAVIGFGALQGAVQRLIGRSGLRGVAFPFARARRRRRAGPVAPALRRVLRPRRTGRPGPRVHRLPRRRAAGVRVRGGEAPQGDVLGGHRLGAARPGEDGKKVDHGPGPPSCLDAAAAAAMMTRCSPMRSFSIDTRPARPCRSASSSAASQSPAASWELMKEPKWMGIMTAA